MTKDQTVYAFIDSQNLNLAIQEVGWSLDFARFRVYLEDKYRVKKAFLFIGYVPGNEALYTFLQKSGYIVIHKPTLEGKRKGKRFIKGNVDAELVLHAMIEYPNYNKAIIVSGDGDFHCLIDYLAQQDKLAHVLIPNPNSYSALLRKFRPYLIYIDKLNKKLEKRRK
jgi:uncharacterized LabA/DUF88 family protein